MEEIIKGKVRINLNIISYPFPQTASYGDKFGVKEDTSIKHYRKKKKKKQREIEARAIQ